MCHFNFFKKRFPDSAVDCQKWLQFIPQNLIFSRIKTNSAKICRGHFKIDCFHGNKLLESSNPTIFMNEYGNRFEVEIEDLIEANTTSTQTTPNKSCDFRYVGDIDSNIQYSPRTNKRALELYEIKTTEQSLEIKRLKRIISKNDETISNVNKTLIKLRDSGHLNSSTSSKLNVTINIKILCNSLVKY